MKLIVLRGHQRLI